ncbi:MAG: UbiA family prenyltransferase, partial [Pseudolabrys sp.]
MPARAKRIAPKPTRPLVVDRDKSPARTVAPSADIKQQLGLLKQAFEQVSVRQNKTRWLKLLRPHQWAKNALVAVPLLTAHHFSLSALGLAALAVVAFCACASSAYILNDLIDIEADRAHPLKRQRPFASGEVSLAAGAVVGIASLAFAFVVAAFVSWTFVGVLGLYFAGTTVYSLHLKRLLVLDAIALAGLYTARVIGGAAAIAVPASEWLLAFSMFVFLSLALIKRYS